MIFISARTKIFV